jgi:two-component system alkaline phosphatase synthesis response regulator PhoP
MIKILLAEDEVSIRVPVVVNLELEGYAVDYVENGVDAIKSLKNGKYDLLILDLMMPLKSGEEVLNEMKSSDITIPTIIMSAKDTPQDRITGLKAGASDYITKPFIIEELLIRVRNILSNLPDKEEKTTVTIGQCNINFKSMVITTLDGQSNNLTAKEARLLKLFMNHKDEVLSRSMILSNVWDDHENPSSRTIDNFITQFRKYFESDPKSPQYFVSVRGVGYMFSSKNSAQ